MTILAKVTKVVISRTRSLRGIWQKQARDYPRAELPTSGPPAGRVTHFWTTRGEANYTSGTPAGVYNLLLDHPREGGIKPLGHPREGGVKPLGHPRDYPGLDYPALLHHPAVPCPVLPCSYYTLLYPALYTPGPARTPLVDRGGNPAPGTAPEPGPLDGIIYLGLRYSPREPEYKGESGKRTRRVESRCTTLLRFVPRASVIARPRPGPEPAFARVIIPSRTRRQERVL